MHRLSFLIFVAVAVRAFSGKVFRISGQPKSGTTWFTAVIGRILEEYVSEHRSCRFSSFPSDNLLKTRLDLHCPTKTLTVSADRKHDIGSTTWFPRDFMQNANFKIPSVGDDSLQQAVEYVLRKQARRRRAVEETWWLPIFRDPRAVVNSACRHGLGWNAASHVNRSVACHQYVRSYIYGTCVFINLRFRFFRKMQQLAGKGTKPRTRITFWNDLKNNFKVETKELSQYMDIPLSAQGLEHVFQDTYSVKHRYNSWAGVEGQHGEACTFMNDLFPEDVSFINATMQKSLMSALKGVFTSC